MQTLMSFASLAANYLQVYDMNQMIQKSEAVGLPSCLDMGILARPFDSLGL